MRNHGSRCLLERLARGFDNDKRTDHNRASDASDSHLDHHLPSGGLASDAFGHRPRLGSSRIANNRCVLSSGSDPTEQEIVICVGNQASCEYESPVGDPGLAYNPDTGTWRQLPDGPLEPAVSPTGVWTGTEVLICCGMEGIGPAGGGIGSSQAAAYNPQTGSWRPLPDAPIGGPFPVSVSTGSELLVVRQSGVAAYNPSTDEWRAMPEAPQPLGRTNQIAWTGSGVIVWPSNVTRSVCQDMALDPDIGASRILPDPPAWLAALDMAYTGDTLIIWGGLPAERGSERAVGSVSTSMQTSGPSCRNRSRNQMAANGTWEVRR